MSKRGKKSDTVTEPDVDPASMQLAYELIEGATGTDNAESQNRMLNQALSATWLPAGANSDVTLMTVLDALAAIAPRDRTEAMLAVQMVSVHEAAMECLRRAALLGQSFEGRDLNLKHAQKFLQLYARQLEVLDKHRGLGQQKITVEHVNVHAGAQAIVGNVDARAARKRKLPPPAPDADLTMTETAHSPQSRRKR